MKTIEEASLENSKAHYLMAWSEELHADADMDFRAGIKYAQQWISVKHGLPKPYTIVLVKHVHFKEDAPYYNTAMYVGKTWMCDATEHLNRKQITHWRYVEIE